MTADHTAQFEEAMALVDGELQPDAADRVRQHMASCADCRQFVGGMQRVSEKLHSWNVDTAPAALRPRQTARGFLSRHKLLAAAAALILVATAVVLPLQLRHSAPSVQGAAIWTDASVNPKGERAEAAAAITERPPSARVVANEAVETLRLGGGPLIIRTASLSIVVRDYNAARNEVDRIARSVNGYIGDLTALGARGEAPSLRGTLRVPATRLDEAIAALKKLGEVQQESLGSDDVTQQWTDLEARLANARASEARLKDVLQNRTGRLSDVLEVEREIARVRGEIEQMEAQRKSLDNAITYAVVRLELVSERKAEAGPGPVSISTRLRNAVVDGYAAAVERAVSLVVFLAEILPTLMLWAAVLVPPAVFIRRRWVVRRPGL